MTTPPIPFNDLRVDPERRRSILAAVDRVLAEGSFVLGAEVAAFEGELARSVGVAHAAGVASGTDALSLGLRALGVEPGDEVIVPAFGATPTAAAVVDAGATPILVDVERDRPHLSLDRCLEAITDRTRAVVLVHLYGIAADAPRWVRALAGSGVALVEDCAQAQGAVLPSGARVGSAGRFAAFSFYPTKNLGAFGDAGAVTSDDPSLIADVRRLRDPGRRDQPGPDLHVGRHSRLDELQAAVLRLQLDDADERAARRRTTSSRYARALEGAVDYVAHGERDAPHLAVALVDDPDDVAARLARAGIGTARHYPLALVDRPEVAAGLVRSHPVPNARAWARRCLSLPLHDGVDAQAVAAVAAALAAACAR